MDESTLRDGQSEDETPIREDIRLYSTLFAVIVVIGVLGLLTVILARGLQTAFLGTAPMVGVAIGVGALTCMVILLGWVFWPAEPRGKRRDPATEFFRALGKGLAFFFFPLLGIPFCERYGPLAWGQMLMKWPWGWWDSWHLDTDHLAAACFSWLLHGAFSIVETIVLVAWVTYSFPAWLAYRGIMLLGTGWWKLATLGPIGAVVAGSLLLGTLGIAHVALLMVFEVNPVLLMCRRTVTKLGHGFDALLSILSRSGPSAPRSKRTTKAWTTKADKRDEVIMVDDGANRAIKQLAERRQQLEGLVVRIPEIVEGAGKVPRVIEEWGGYIARARRRAELRSLTKTGRVAIDHLKLVNELYEEYLRHKKIVDDIVRHDEGNTTRDLEAKLARLRINVEIEKLTKDKKRLGLQDDLERRRLEVELKRLDAEEAALKAEAATIAQPPSRQQRQARGPAGDMLKKARSLKELDEALEKLIKRYPDREEDFRSMAEHHRQEIITEGRG